MEPEQNQREQRPMGEYRYLPGDARWRSAAAESSADQRAHELRRVGRPASFIVLPVRIEQDKYATALWAVGERCRA